MVPSVEIYDPRLGTWMSGEPMKQSRGYSATAVVGESIYVIGGLTDNKEVLDTIERYREGEGWEITQSNSVGKRTFASAIVFRTD
ncbi:kelch-like protein diablo [Dorcoceras hygrometricum]|uniref:Kelch-like protein diablo n=1 Tax=Dorcoceras hygrometricum TaxID=472368 RepID=A0A2Z6ZQV2_9LAMI|nr:kelch-like protein diablo [Dorcoceras hygrometricum]